VEDDEHGEIHESAAKLKFQVGDIITSDWRSGTNYEVLEVLDGGKLKLKPMSGGLGEFVQKADTFEMVKPKNPPVPKVYKSRPTDFERAEKYIKKIVDRLEAHAADIADEVYNQFRPQFEEAMSDVQQDPDVDEAIQVGINDAISDAMDDFHVPQDLEDIVRTECLTELHYPGGRVVPDQMVNVKDLSKKSALRLYSPTPLGRGDWRVKEANSKQAFDYAGVAEAVTLITRAKKQAEELSSTMAALANRASGDQAIQVLLTKHTEDVKNLGTWLNSLLNRDMKSGRTT
jgi:hypothetical protein